MRTDGASGVILGSYATKVGLLSTIGKMDYSTDTALSDLRSNYKTLTKDQLAAKAVDIATQQLMASSEFKKPRMETLTKYWRLYDGKTTKKLRQLFNVPIPVFPGMIDTLNAEYDTPIEMTFREGDAADYFKVQKLNGAFRMEVLDSAQNSKWDSKLSMARKHAIINGRAILKYDVESEPEYKSELDVVNLKNFHFQPRGGLYLENHLFAGEEDIDKTKDQLISGALSGAYDSGQVKLLLSRGADQNYLPDNNQTYGERLSRFKPLGLDPDNHSYVGQSVYKLASWIIELDGTRYYLCFHPWTKTWLRFEKWADMCSSDLMPWVSYATHEDDENFLSKSYGDDLYPAADAIVAMVNQEFTNREKRNFGARAYDKDMFPDVRKLDEAMHRPDALVPADTKNGTRRISEGVYEFKVGELGGTVNLVDWITGTLGRNTGANDLAQGSVQEVSKKASVTFAEQKSVSKRVSWASQPFQNMMADLGKRFIYGLKDHMPARKAIRMMGETGWDWDEITRLDLNTTKDVDVLIVSTDKQAQESELKKEKREKALTAIGADPLLAPVVSPKWRARQLLSTVGDFEEDEVTEALDVKSTADKKSLARAADAIQKILRNQTPEIWYGANIAFIQKIVDFANDRRSTLKDKFNTLIDYAMQHTEIAKANIERKVAQEASIMGQPTPTASAPTPTPTPSGIPGGVSHAMDIAQANA